VKEKFIDYLSPACGILRFMSSLLGFAAAIAWLFPSAISFCGAIGGVIAFAIDYGANQWYRKGLSDLRAQSDLIDAEIEILKEKFSK